MAPLFDAATVHIETVSTTVSFSHTVGNNSNRVIYLSIGLDLNSGSVLTNTPTCDGNNMTELSGSPVSNGGGSIRQHVWRYVAPAVGSVTLAFTVNTLGFNVAAIAVSVYDTDQATPNDTPGTSSANNSSSSTATAGSASGDLVLDFITTNRTLTCDGSQTERANDDTNAIRCGASTEAGAASVAMDWTLSSAGRIAHMAFSINPAAGGGGGTILPMMMHHHGG